jgi:DNA adenine methylase
LTYSLHYTAQKRYLGSEVMFFCRQLTISEDLIPKPGLAA